MGDYERECEFDDGYEQGFHAGVAVAFGIVGMAEAIKKNHSWACDYCFKYYPGMCYWKGQFICDECCIEWFPIGR